MVRDKQQAPRAKAVGNSPGGGRQDQHLDAQLLDHPHRKCDGFQVVALVIVEPTLKNDHRLAANLAAKNLSGMPRHLRYGEMGDLSVRNDPGTLDPAREVVQSRAEHNRNARGLTGRKTKNRRRFAGSGMNALFDLMKMIQPLS